MLLHLRGNSRTWSCLSCPEALQIWLLSEQTFLERDFVSTMQLDWHLTENTIIVRCHWWSILFMDENRFTLSTLQIWTRDAVENVMLPATSHIMIGLGWVSDGLGRNILEGRTDLYVLTNNTLTAVRYWDEILRAAVRPYTGAVFLGSYHTCQHSSFSRESPVFHTHFPTPSHFVISPGKLP